MRALDFYLNACQILTVAKFYGSKRNKIIAKFKYYGVISKSYKHDCYNWILFANDIFLYQIIKLVDDLKPLLSYSSFPYPNQDKNYVLASEK